MQTYRPIFGESDVCPNPGIFLEGGPGVVRVSIIHSSALSVCIILSTAHISDGLFNEQYNSTRPANVWKRGNYSRAAIPCEGCNDAITIKQGRLGC